MSQYWEGFNERYMGILIAADVVAIKQDQSNNQHKAKDTGIFDKELTHISLYKRQGKFITPYHASLMQKRKNNEKTCPVFEISFRAFVQSEKNKAYKNSVYSVKELKRPEIEMNLLDLNRSHEEFIEEYLKEAFFNQDKEFVFDNRNQKVIRDLVSYFTRQQDCPLNIKKGICLYGGIGTGKSTIMKQLSKFTKNNDLPTQFDFVYMDDVYMDCDSSGLKSLDAYRFKSCSFDDIGMRADSNVNNYGTKINAYRELVRRQYIRFARPTPCLSHYTTNIAYNNEDYSKQLAKVFGGRELDRFVEMCNFVELGGASRRDKL